MGEGGETETPDTQASLGSEEGAARSSSFFLPLHQRVPTQRAYT